MKYNSILEACYYGEALKVSGEERCCIYKHSDTEIKTGKQPKTATEFKKLIYVPGQKLN